MVPLGPLRLLPQVRAAETTTQLNQPLSTKTSAADGTTGNHGSSEQPRRRTEHVATIIWGHSQSLLLGLLRETNVGLYIVVLPVLLRARRT